jgi:hypothetical protein
VSFDGVKVSWRENEVVVQIAVLLGCTGMAPFVSRNRREKKDSLHWRSSLIFLVVFPINNIISLRVVRTAREDARMSGKEDAEHTF